MISCIMVNVARGTELLSNILTVGSSRRECNVIYLTQNLFTNKQEQRDISINCSYIVLFKNPRDAVSAHRFFGQLDPKNSGILLDIYREATEKPYSYLIIDLHQTTSDKNRYISNIFSEHDETPALYRF